MMTENEVIALTQTVEAIFERYNVYLNTDRFNALADYLHAIVTECRENGE